MAETLRNKRIAIYARFSSEKQSETSIDDQVRRCREFVEKEGGQVEPAQVFADYATSGASLARSGFEAMMSLTTGTRPAIDVIVAEDLSRITRDLADGALLFRRLQFQGVKLLGVADGVDTSSKNAKLTYTMKNLVADIYLDDLRDKTLRGLEGRHHASLSTGNPPYGYRSVAIPCALGTKSGFRVELDEQKAAIVRRVFSLFLEGRSLCAIAKLLHGEGVPAPRAGTRHRRKGWVNGTIRAFLHNEKYVGIWRYKETQWVKIPGQNKRVSRRREASQVLEQVRADLRIIDQETWHAAKARLAAIAAHYTRNPDGTPKGRAASGKQHHYLLSGLLFCGTCGSPMTIHGGKSPSYRCPDHTKRGTCPNALPVQELLARNRILSTLRERLLSPAGIAYARKRIAERLGELGTTQNADLAERRRRLDRIEARIAGLIQFISDGDQSAYIRSTLLDFEVQAKTEKEAIAAAVHDAAKPIRLPSPAELEALVYDLDATLARDPLVAREVLRRLFKDGRIVLEPQTDGTYFARSEVYPMKLLSERDNGRPWGFPGTAVSSASSGGVI